MISEKVSEPSRKANWLIYLLSQNTNLFDELNIRPGDNPDKTPIKYDKVISKDLYNQFITDARLQAALQDYILNKGKSRKLKPENEELLIEVIDAIENQYRGDARFRQYIEMLNKSEETNTQEEQIMKMYADAAAARAKKKVPTSSESAAAPAPAAAAAAAASTPPVPEFSNFTKEAKTFDEMTKSEKSKYKTALLNWIDQNTDKTLTFTEKQSAKTIREAIKTKYGKGKPHKANDFGDDDELAPYLTKRLRPSPYRNNNKINYSSSEESSGEEDGSGSEMEINEDRLGKGRKKRSSKKLNKMMEDMKIMAGMPVKEAAIIIEKKRGKGKSHLRKGVIKPVINTSNDWFD
jgi:uncharacterized protein with PIN domain